MLKSGWPHIDHINADKWGITKLIRTAQLKCKYRLETRIRAWFIQGLSRFPVLRDIFAGSGRLIIKLVG